MAQRFRTIAIVVFVDLCCCCWIASAFARRGKARIALNYRKGLSFCVCRTTCVFYRPRPLRHRCRSWYVHRVRTRQRNTSVRTHREQRNARRGVGRRIRASPSLRLAESSRKEARRPVVSYFRFPGYFPVRFYVR